MRNTDLTVESGGVRLAGTLCEPDQPPANTPLVLLIGGSGPLDRDTNMKGQRLGVFPPIVDDLAIRGIASFRYDKRGAGKSTGEFYTAGQTEFLADAVACLDHFAGDQRFGKRFVLGYSEGTVVAARLSLERLIDGLVLLAPLMEDAEQSLMKQAMRLEEALREMRGPGGAVARLAVAAFGRTGGVTAAADRADQGRRMSRRFGRGCSASTRNRCAKSWRSILPPFTLACGCRRW
jgi:alpha-beta hydrolase superfamily lysophospholipase